MNDRPTRRLPVHLLPCLPGLPVLPLASALGAAGGLAPRGAADRRIFARTAATAAQEIVLVGTPDAAEVLVHPHDALEHPAAAEQASRTAAGARRPLALFSTSDDVRPSQVGWGTLWRTSGFRSRLLPHERVATGDVPDLLEERLGHHPEVLPWNPVPSIGFIGHVASGLRSLGYLRKGWQNYHGFTLRERVLRAFEAGPAVTTRFIRRQGNLGPPMAGVDGDEDRRRKRLEYVDSVFGCDYALCVRGLGNWSFRFFEALSAGRIPVVVDTDSVLPGDGEIDWARHACRIPAQELRDAPRLVAAFHARLGPAGFEAMQRANRALWEERLEPGRFGISAIRSLAPGRPA